MLKTAIRSGVSAIMFFLWTGTLWAADRGTVLLDLVRDGAPAAAIVVAQQPTRSAQFAAAELQYHFRKITGATLPIVDAKQTVAGNRILVGESEATAIFGLKSNDFAHQEYLIRFQPGTLILMGRDKDDRGKLDYEKADASTFPGLMDEQSTCYAVYDFLERHAQVRWYLPTELGLCYTATKTLRASGGEVRRRPAMPYRDAYTAGSQATADLCGDTVDGPSPPPKLPWREQLLFTLRHRLGGVLPYVANHSLYGYYERFWKEGDAKPGPTFEKFHPEYFAQGYPGKPEQMCYTNPGLVRQVVQDARDYFDGKGLKPGAYAAGDFFAVVPMDNSQFCKCPKCAKLIDGKKEAVRGKGLPFNDMASNYLFAFVNEVAREIKKSHPQKRISTLAYNYYSFPPTDVKLESNVWIQPCLVSRNIYSREYQENDRAILDAWVAESADRPKMLWVYYCFPSLVATSPLFPFDGDKRQFRCFPGFFAHTIVKQMAVYYKAGVRGIFCEPAYIAYRHRSALMDQLEYYVTWKLADDPTLDGNALIDEFFTRYYGSAALPMKAFYILVEQTYAEPANYPPAFLSTVERPYIGGDRVIGNLQTEEVAWKHLGTEPRMTQLGLLMDEARAAAKTDIEKQRVALFDKGIWQYMQAGRKDYLLAHPSAP